MNQCVQMCQQTAQQLRTLSNQATDPMLKGKLFEAAHHLDLCIEECKFTVQRVQQPQMAGAMA